MSRRIQETITITIRTAGQKTGLSGRVVRECVQRRLVGEPLSDADLAELRRIRRLQELGVNMPGIEVILHMRQRIRALQTELERLERHWGRYGWLALEDLERNPSAEPWQRLLPWDSSWSSDED